MIAESFELHEPTSLQEALHLAHDFPGKFRYLAGGTDILPGLFRGLGSAPHLISLEGVPELRAFDPEHGVVGASTWLSTLERDPILAARFPALAQAAHNVASPSIRNSATLGGNLLLDTRCIFYNQSQFWRESNGYCLKFQGTECQVVPKGAKCYAVYSGDLAPALLALGAVVEIAGPRRRRQVPLGTLFPASGDGREPYRLGPEEILVSIGLPHSNLGSAYAKLRARGMPDFPEAAASVALHATDQRLDYFRIALSGVGSRPVVLDELTEPYLGHPLPEADISKISQEVRRWVHPVANTHLLSDYRQHATSHLVRTQLERLWNAAKESTSGSPSPPSSSPGAPSKKSSRPPRISGFGKR